MRSGGRGKREGSSGGSHVSQNRYSFDSKAKGGKVEIKEKRGENTIGNPL